MTVVHYRAQREDASDGLNKYGELGTPRHVKRQRRARNKAARAARRAGR
jgi:hypothetical protein